MDHKLRQDQIWFAEKMSMVKPSSFRFTILMTYLLSRGDFGYKKRYLEGRLGATQIINHSALLEVLGNKMARNKKGRKEKRKVYILVEGETEQKYFDFYVKNCAYPM